MLSHAVLLCSITGSHRSSHQTMPLSDTQARRTRPGDKDRFLSDGRGLYLRIRPNGNRTWMLKTQRGGKTTWATLGTYPALSLAQAREEAHRRRNGPSNRLSVSEVWEAYYTLLQATTKRPDVVAQQVKANLLPSLGARPIADVRRAEIAAAVNQVARRGALTSARRTLTYAKQLWRFALSQGYITEDATAGMRGIDFGGREKSRDRVLSLEEIQHFIGWIRALPPSRTRLALAFLLLTGQRASEALQLHPSQIHGRWWTIPANVTKQKRVQKVYLSPPAVAVMRWAQRIDSDAPFGCSLYSLAQATRRYCASRQIEPFRPHDLRRTMSTHLSRLGVAPHIVEKMLGHQMQGVMAVYNRADYFPERTAAWRQWGACLYRLYLDQVHPQRKQLCTNISGESAS